MRIEKNVPPVTIQGNKVQFREWVLAIGDGLQESIAIGDDPEPLWITIPEELFIHYSGDPLEAIVKEIYSELQHMHGDLEYIRNRAILTPLNEHVENVNNTVLQMLPGDFKEYKSCDSVCKGSSHSEVDEVLYPPEFLNSLKFSGMPNHDIKVKVGAPIMLLRNLNAKKGLCNGYTGNRQLIPQQSPVGIKLHAGSVCVPIKMSTKLEKLPGMITGVWSDDSSMNLEATTQVHKLLSIGGSDNSMMWTAKIPNSSKTSKNYYNYIKADNAGNNMQTLQIE
ncbi:ATP-dependent DNA helicase [Heracleum sosnowskyi]|uniref:ATP-dependent DNA helicase n=1 Tax=Heracleum sosnowskyi TaxID=360622 RepID=A0AAD8IQC8_9APIA|nr:ATP-dependent DNA helicase [Heracleum sosnowskyi]